MRRRTWIGAAAAAGLTTVAAAGLAVAQERQPGQEQAPAAHRMEKGATQSGEGMGQGSMEKGERAQIVQAQSPAEERLRNGRAGQEKMGQEGMKAREEGKAAQKEKMNGGQNSQTTAQGAQNTKENGAAAGQQAGQANQPQEKGKTTAQGAQNTKENGVAAEQQTGQANQPEEKGKTTAQGQTPANENRAEMQNNRQGEGQTAQTSQNGQNTQGAAHVNPQNVRVQGNTHISNESASRIADTLLATSTSQNVNVNVNVGAALPGDVRLLPLPANVVDLVPEYRGYEYVVVNDEIVIVQPSTRNVVEIIDTGGGAEAMAATRVTRCNP
jgi:Protein of unknown function (DUF1236)